MEKAIIIISVCSHPNILTYCTSTTMPYFLILCSQHAGICVKMNRYPCVLPGHTEVVFILFCQEKLVQILGKRVDKETLDSSTLAKTLTANLSSLNFLIEGKARSCDSVFVFYAVLANVKEVYDTWRKDCLLTSIYLLYLLGWKRLTSGCFCQMETLNPLWTMWSNELFNRFKPIILTVIKIVLYFIPESVFELKFGWCLDDGTTNTVQHNPKSLLS